METLLAGEETVPRQSAACADSTLNVEDARRRFILALRVMAGRREKDEARESAAAELTTKLTADLHREIRAYRVWRWRRRLRRFAMLAAVGGFLYFRHEFPWPLWWIFFAVMFKAAADERGNRRRKIAGDLARTRDPRAINVLAAAARESDSATRAAAIDGLKRVLPYVKASDRDCVTPSGMTALISALRSLDWELVLAVLKALEQVGDARAAPEVKRLADAYVPHGDVRALFGLRWREWIRLSNSVAWERIREEAKHCLAALEERAELDRQRNLLLRPSQAPDEPSTLLLRPAAAGTQTPEQLLLRPAPEQ